MAGPGRWVTGAGMALALGAGVEDWRGVVALVVGFVVFLMWALVVVGSDQRTDNLGRLLRPGSRTRPPRRHPVRDRGA